MIVWLQREGWVWETSCLCKGQVGKSRAVSVIMAGEWLVLIVKLRAPRFTEVTNLWTCL